MPLWARKLRHRVITQSKGLRLQGPPSALGLGDNKCQVPSTSCTLIRGASVTVLLS